jgi:hypothetical protein
MINNEERKTVREGTVEVKWSRINQENVEDFRAKSTYI